MKGKKQKSTRGGLSDFLETSSRPNVELSSSDVQTVVTFSAEDREQRQFVKMARQMSSRDMGLDIAALEVNRRSDRDEHLEEECLQVLEDEAVSQKKGRRRSNKSERSSTGSLSDFLNTPPNSSTFQAAAQADDVESVVTFSTLEKEREHFSRLSMRSTRKLNIDLSDVIINNANRKKIQPAGRKKKVIATVRKQ